MGSGLIWIATGSFAVSTFFTALMLRIALRRNWLDVPNARSSHALPTPRGAGLSIVVAFFLSIILLTSIGMMDVRDAMALMVGGSAMALVGLLDDRQDVRPSLRLGVHVTAALLSVIALKNAPQAALSSWGLHSVWATGAIAAILVVWIANLFNFMDGIDGLAGSEAVFVLGSAAWLNADHGGSLALTVAMASLAAADLGFLVWNWPPARIFMGDVGSGFIGFTIAVFALLCTERGILPIEVWGILGGVFVVDSTTTLIRRILRGDRWYESHRIHAYQHLARRWKSHLRVTISISAINCVWLFPWAFLAARAPAYAKYCLIIALVPLAALALWMGSGRKEMTADT